MRALVASAALMLLVLPGCRDDDEPAVAAKGSTQTIDVDEPAAAPEPSTATVDVVLAELTESHGCGYGFQAGRPDQRVGLFAVPEDGPAQSGTVTLPDERWAVTVRLGDDLFANWCDDVMQAGEPERVVRERWEVVEGVLDVVVPADGEQGAARLSATGLVAVRPDGERVPLGDVVIENRWYGTIPG